MDWNKDRFLSYLIFAFIAAICASAIKLLFEMKIHIYNDVLFILYFIGILLVIIVFSLAFLLLSISELKMFLMNIIKGIPSFLNRLFFALLFLGVFVLLLIFMLFPDIIPLPSHITIPDTTQILQRDVQIIGCICSAGVLGGFVNKFLGHLSDSEYTVQFWPMLTSLFCSLFISLVIFLLVRAGILKSVEVDTFNVYGVTGLSAITGYFAENIIGRLKSIYETLLGQHDKKMSGHQEDD
jgi:hypothetical protein